MPSYLYRYVGPSGRTRFGWREASDEQSCRAVLAAEGIYPLFLRRLSWTGEKKIDQRRFAIFLRQLAMALKTGVPLLETLHDMAAEQSQAGMQQFIRRLESRVMAGQTLADALGAERWIEPMLVQWLRIGEKQGRLAEVLSDIHRYLTHREETKRKLQQELLYPLMVLAAVVVVSLLMFLVVMPLLARQFMTFGTEIPWMMRIPLLAHDALLAYGMEWGAILLVLGGIVFAYCWREYPQGWLRQHIYRWALDVPILKRVLVLTLYVPFGRLLGELLRSGVPASEAMEDIYLYFEKRIGAEDVAFIEERMSKGGSFSDAIADAPFVPELARQMIFSGERHGRLPEALLESSEYYETVLLEELSLWMRLVEPVAIVLLGLLVLGMALGLFLPILDSYQLMIEG